MVIAKQIKTEGHSVAESGDESPGENLPSIREAQATLDSSGSS